MMLVDMREPSLPDHLDTQQCLGGHLRVGVRQQVGHPWTDLGPSQLPASHTFTNI